MNYYNENKFYKLDIIIGGKKKKVTDAHNPLG